MQFFASVASADQLAIGAEIDRLRGWPHVHFDIEDGNFTPNITFGLKMLRAVAQKSGVALDVHMMANRPLDYLPALREAGVGAAFAHIEALDYPLLFLHTARRLGMRAGLAINVKTPFEAVMPFVQAMDGLLVMTAEPDAAGENLLPAALEKAERAARALPIPVRADGALNEAAIARLHAAGAAGCVLGRLAFRAHDPAATLARLAETYA